MAIGNNASKVKMAAPRSNVNEIVLAGDVLQEISKDVGENARVILGPGLRRESEIVLATKCGLLRRKGQNTYWIDSYQKRYVPSRGESVIGIVTGKGKDVFRVDIGSSESATLSYLAFEGSTKRNRPIVQIGDIVYAKLLVASRDMEPELVCVDRHGKSAGMGVLSDGGFMFQTSINLIRKILAPSCVLWKALGPNFQFEMAIGLNGRVWIKARDVKQTIAIANAICLSETMTDDEITNMCKRLVDALAGF